MAAALGEAADAAHLAAQLDVMQRAYDARFWNETVGGYVGALPPLEHQTLCGLAINAMAGASLPHAAEMPLSVERMSPAQAMLHLLEQRLPL